MAPDSSQSDCIGPRRRYRRRRLKAHELNSHQVTRRKQSSVQLVPSRQPSCGFRAPRQVARDTCPAPQPAGKEYRECSSWSTLGPGLAAGLILAKLYSLPRKAEASLRTNFCRTRIIHAKKLKGVKSRKPKVYSRESP